MMTTPTSQLGHFDYVGYRFKPSDYELVNHFLRRRVTLGAQAYSHNVIHEYPAFFGNEEPWELWQHFHGSLEANKLEPEMTMYFFTTRKRQSEKSTRFDRKVGSGTWSGQNPKPIYGDEEETVVIGTKREFRYEGGCDEGHNNAWLMQEYEIVVADYCCDDVLCTLRKSPRKAPPSSRQCVAAIGDNKRKMTSGAAQLKAKRCKKGESCVGYDAMRMEESQTSIVEKTNLEEMGEGFHPMLQREMPSSSSHYENDQDCCYTSPELVVSTDLVNPQTQTYCDENNNNMSLVVSGDIGQEEEERVSLEGNIVDQPEMGGMSLELGGLESPFMDDIELAALEELFKYLDDQPPSGSSSDSTDMVIPQTATSCDENKNLNLVVFGDIGQGENGLCLQGTIDDQQKIGGIGFEWDSIDLPILDDNDLFTFEEMFKPSD